MKGNRVWWGKFRQGQLPEYRLPKISVGKFKQRTLLLHEPLLFCLAMPGSFTSLTMFGNHFFGPCNMTNKLLDRAPLRFAPQSTVLPAWLAPFAAKQLVASFPHNATGHTWSHLVTPGHSWSQMVTNTYRVALIVPWPLVGSSGLLVTPGHSWSQLVTKCSLVTGGPLVTPFSLGRPLLKRYRPDGRTEGCSPLIV